MPDQDKKLTFPESIKLTLGKGGAQLFVEAPPNTTIGWIHFRDQDKKLQVFEYPDHVTLVPIEVGTYQIGVTTPELVAQRQPPLYCEVAVDGDAALVPAKRWTWPTLPKIQLPSMDKTWNFTRNAATIIVIIAVLAGGVSLVGKGLPDWLNPINWIQPVNPFSPDAPIKEPGLRYLAIFETSSMDKLTKGQLDALYGTNIRSYLNSHCVVGADGKTKEWRMFDKDTDMKNETKLWQDAFAKLKAAMPPDSVIPWCLISNGRTGFIGAMPEDPALMELLKKHTPTN